MKKFEDFQSPPLSEREIEVFACFFKNPFKNGVKCVMEFCQETSLPLDSVLEAMLQPRHAIYLELRADGRFSLNFRIFILLNPTFTKHCLN